jgi:uncharacterized delta-60 repeat protein
MNKLSRSVISSFLWVAFSAGLISGCGGGGGSSSAPSPTAIDISHDSTSGLTFGKSVTDQLRRYQTFIAGSYPNVVGVDVKIRKANNMDYYNTVSVELWEADAQHKPSKLLAMASFTSDTITSSFSVASVPLSYHGLVPGKEYAIVLEQFNAFGANAGFEWCSKQVRADCFFGKFDRGVWGDESSLGDGWLKVHVDRSSGSNPVPGSLDTSFGTGGTTTASIGVGSPAPRSLAIQPDGKMVVAFSDVLGMSGFILARFKTDGSLDTTFNSTGIVSTPVAATMSNAVALQPDGKILVAGSSGSGSNSLFALARYNMDGHLDTTFNSTGIVTTLIGANSYANAIAIQPDGKIVVAGSSYSSPIDSIALARYNANGSLDTSFNSSGIVTTLVGSSSVANAVAIQPDGKIVVAGGSYSGANQAVTLARYNANGSLDTTFTATGTVTTSIGMSSSANAVAIQPDGKIVVAGNSSPGIDHSFTLARYDADGNLDTAFHSAGTVTTSIGTSSYANAVALQPDGKIVAAGNSSSGGSWSFVVARYTSEGILDTTFNSSGIATALTGTTSGASAAAIQPDGMIVAVGPFDVDTAVARYHQ